MLTVYPQIVYNQRQHFLGKVHFPEKKNEIFSSRTMIHIPLRKIKSIYGTAIATITNLSYFAKLNLYGALLCFGKHIESEDIIHFFTLQHNKTAFYNCVYYFNIL